jgi:hypothetical protein
VATINQVKTQIENANALGVANLKKKGVTIPENASTYEIMRNIANVSVGDGIQPLDYTVTFAVDGEPYEIASVKAGNKVNAPVINPTIENSVFQGWQVDGAEIGFPYPPEKNTTIDAIFCAVRSEMEITKAEYLLCTWNQSTSTYGAKQEIRKVNSEKAIVGWFKQSSASQYQHIMVIGETEESVAISGMTKDMTTISIEYESKSYFVSYNAYKTNYGMTEGTRCPEMYALETRATKSPATEDEALTIAKELLDYYYYKI